MDELQRIVDSLASRLGRSVAIDDPNIRLRAHSAHFEDVDKVRLESIMTRQVPPEVAAWVNAHDVRTAEGPVRVRRNPELGYEPRVCIPIRYESELLGYLWLIDADGSLTEPQIQAASQAADAAADAMYRDRLRDDLRSGRERELLRDLLSDNAELREHAATTLLDEELIAPARSYCAMVIRHLPADGAQARSPVAAVNRALEEVRARHSRRSVLYLARPDHWLMVAAVNDRSSQGGPNALAEETHDIVHRAAERARPGRILVGLGNAYRTLDRAHESYREAQYAVRVGVEVSGYGPVIPWQRLGIYRMLIKLPVAELTADALPDSLMVLVNRKGGDVLLATLETYLDLAGNVGATASTLNLHRVSLYARLRRIEEIAGISLADGQERLMLHLGLKLARLAGVYPPRTAHATTPSPVPVTGEETVGPSIAV